MTKISPRFPLPPPTLSDLGWGVLHGAGFVLGVSLVIAYAIGGMAGPAMGELTFLFGVLALFTAQQARIWAAVVGLGGFTAWASFDPVRDAVASAFLFGLLLGVGGMIGAAYLFRRRPQPPTPLP